MVSSEFSHLVKLSEIGGKQRAIELSANEEQRAALAARFALIAIEQLTAKVTLSATASGAMASGKLHAEVIQSCVASGEPVPASIDEAVHIRFVAAPESEDESEVELEADDCDVMFHDGQMIDVGEAIAQSLALALDPYPRSPDADAVLKAAGVKSEEEAGPFGALASLKDKLAKK